MSKEMQEKADIIVKELKSALSPIKKEINNIKKSSGKLI
jgi:hypothetical protein